MIVFRGRLYRAGTVHLVTHLVDAGMWRRWRPGRRRLALQRYGCGCGEPHGYVCHRGCHPSIVDAVGSARLLVFGTKERAGDREGEGGGGGAVYLC